MGMYIAKIIKKLPYLATCATITVMKFRIRIFNFCTSNCTPYKPKSVIRKSFLSFSNDRH